jgi:hypothetical protein
VDPGTVLVMSGTVFGALLGSAAVVFGALVAGIFAVAAARHSSRSESRQWLRDQRLRAYADVAISGGQFVSAMVDWRNIDGTKGSWDEWERLVAPRHEAITQAITAVNLLGPPSVVDSAHHLYAALCAADEAEAWPGGQVPDVVGDEVRRFYELAGKVLK